MGGRGASSSLASKYNFNVSDVNEFFRVNKDVFKEQGIKNANVAREIYKSHLYDSFKRGDAKEISKEDAIDTIREKVSTSTLDGWFRDANNEYKPKIENAVISDKALRNANLNIAYHNYKETTGSKASFNEWLNTPQTMYRGGNKNFTKNDVFISFTPDKKSAQKFGNNITTIKVKPIDTLGSMQTTGEQEFLVPMRKLGKTKFN